MATRVGQQFGNYKLTRLLGTGGFAEVYLGEHIYLKSSAAIKVLLTQLGQDDTANFLAEARTLVSLKHPHIVRMLDFGMQENVPFLVMEYAPNGTLRQRFPKGTHLSPATVVPYVKQIASALQYAHNQKLIHRDVKPENMLLQDNDDLLLSDFGVAVIAQSTRHQGTQDVIGTATYMAPEQINGQARPSSDQYALGAVVYEWLSGRSLFQGTFTEVCSQHMFAIPQPLRAMAPAISPTIEQVVMTALAKDPAQRFAHVQAFATALEQACQAERSVTVTPTPRSASQPSFAQPFPATFYGRDDQTFQDAWEESVPSYSALTISPGSAPQSGFAAATQEPRNFPSPPRRRSPMGPLALLLILALVILTSGGGLFYYATTHQFIGKTQSASTPSVLPSPTIHLAPTPTTFPTDPQDIYTAATSGSPVLYSSLTGQDVNSWDVTNASGGGGCSFTGGSYHTTMPQSGYVALCLAHATNFSNFAFQVNMTILTGANQDGGGLIFRSNGNAFYRLRIGVTGTYDLVNQTNSLISTSNEAIKTGLNQTNVLTVVARNQQIYLYINKSYITTITDSASSSGQIGLFAVGWTTPTDVSFNNAEVWQL
jgi:serine/threonine protein kinase